MTRRKRARRLSPKPKTPKLSDKWLRTSQEIKSFRDKAIKEQGDCCAVTKEKPIRPALDHSHCDGKVRGVLSGFVNMFEGRTRKAFLKYVDKHTDLTYAQFLIALGEYLEKDYSDNPLHHMTIETKARQLNRTLKDVIAERLFEDFGVDVRTQCSKMLKQELIDLYLECYIKQLEDN